MRHFSLIFLFLLSPVLLAQESALHISPTGFGPVKVGMSVSQASKALGIALLTKDNILDPDCYHVYPSTKFVGLIFMVRKNRIARITAYPESGITTDSGIGIGDSEEKIKRAYPKGLEIKPHENGGPKDRYITYWSHSSKTRGVRFELVNGKVELIHGGNESITLIEGCS